MRTKLALALTALFALAGCGSGDKTENSAAPVAAVTAPAGKAWVDMVTKTKDGGYLQGNPNAPIKLVEYGSRNCPYCGLFGRTAPEPLRKNYISTGKVSWEFRDFLIHGAPDLAAALLNQCVPDETFFPMLDRFFENQDQFLQRTESLYKTNQALIQQLLHLRGAYHDPFMFLPVTVPPLAAALMARTAFTRPARQDRLTRAWLGFTALLGFGGVAFHAWGVSRNMGGWANWRQTVLNGPPLPAPPSFTGLALAGLAALALLKDHPDA